MNLNISTSDTFERNVVHPLVTSIERLSIMRESSTNRLLDIPTLERRIGSLDAQMTRHVYVIMNDAIIDKLESLDDDLHRNLKSEIRTESATFIKIEGGIVQRFESAAGTNTWNVQAEGASQYVRSFVFCNRFCIWERTIQIIISFIIASLCSLYHFLRPLYHLSVVLRLRCSSAESIRRYRSD